MDTETKVYTRYSILTEDINRGEVARLCREHRIDCNKGRKQHCVLTKEERRYARSNVGEQRDIDRLSGKSRHRGIPQGESLTAYGTVKQYQVGESRPGK